MKKVLLALCCGILIFGGCKENDAPLITSNGVDSTYIATPIPKAYSKSVLVEEFTGQSCSNCPAAHAQLDTIVSNHKGFVNVIGLYLFNIPQADPPGGSLHDLRDSLGTQIASSVFGSVNQLPAGSVDRVPQSGSLQLGSGLWNSQVTSELAQISPVNIDIASTYDEKANEATIKVTVVYTQAVADDQNLSVVIVEDGVVDIQEYPVFSPLYPNGYDSTYVFNDIFRGMVSAPSYGDPIKPLGPKVAGSAYQRTYKYSLKTIQPVGSALQIVPKNCRVIAFVNMPGGSDKHIVQSAQAPLIP